MAKCRVPPRDMFCYHEAAHAVVGSLVGLEPIELELTGTFGATRFPPVTDSAALTIDLVRCHAVATYAGWCVERHIGQPATDFFGRRTDYYSRTQSGVQGADTTDLALVAAFAEMLARSGVGAPREIIADVRDECMQIVRVSYPRIARFARELVTRRDQEVARGHVKGWQIRLQRDELRLLLAEPSGSGVAA